ncbi:MAG: lipase family protein [Tannerellaceae bacterium]|jgi:pimeloyl-ACP methyl ester carboxylesterase|nr:lipase family protein [Tannerellaceae bacterium]
MKRTGYYNTGKALLSASLLWLLAGCSDGGETPPIPESPFTYFISVSDSAQYTAEEFAAKTVGTSYPVTFPENGADIRVDILHYTTVDPTGQPVVASGIVAYPLPDANREAQPVAAADVLLAEHYTIAANREAPSETMCIMESAAALFGYVVMTPDYLGFGVSRELPHPYLHAKSTARASIDFLFAAREYFETKAYPLKEEIYIAGYSQGGAAALAVQQMAEEEYPDDVHIVKVIAGGGPYDLTAIVDELRATGEMTRPSMLAMIPIGLDYGDNLHLDYNNVFTGALLSNYNEWIISKNYTTDEIDDRIGMGAINRYLHADFFAPAETTNSEFRKLNESLVRNSLIDWTPRAPIVLVHGTSDELAPFYCAQNALNSFRERGCDVTLIPVPGQTHYGSATLYALQLILNLNILPQ